MGCTESSSEVMRSEVRGRLAVETASRLGECVTGCMTKLTGMGGLAEIKQKSREHGSTLR